MLFEILFWIFVLIVIAIVALVVIWFLIRFGELIAEVFSLWWAIAAPFFSWMFQIRAKGFSILLTRECAIQFVGVLATFIILYQLHVLQMLPTLHDYERDSDISKAKIVRKRIGKKRRIQGKSI